MKIVVFDDDPTGSQTVYGCQLLLRWNKEILTNAMNNISPLLFILTNTRSLSPKIAEHKLREICQILKEVIQENNYRYEDIIFVSRGDSTLRGHWTLEPKVINQELGPFDATFHVPAFFEGGRTTVDGTHLLDGKPVHRSIFAKDKIFGYSTSFLPYFLEYKSNGEINSNKVKNISIKQLKEASYSLEGMFALRNYLSALSSNHSVIVDAEIAIDLDAFSSAIKYLMNEKRFLFRSSASLINSLSEIYSANNSFKDFSSLRIRDQLGCLKPGLILVGSHVQLADDQLEYLFQNSSCLGVELPVEKIASIAQKDDNEVYLSELKKNFLKKLLDIIEMRKTPVLYSSRGEFVFSSNENRMQFGIYLAELMSDLISKISNKLGYIISKGGITTHILLTRGLGLSSVNLRGQIIPGLSVVASDNQNQPELPIITFPGNLGDKTTLFKVWNLMDSI
ncbi:MULTISPECIES: four-carbon acid sugar kinase family protein [unclassified Prochlorococcus]|uniref:four-carbon acid sugar kinase family protein n=1 Tax=unclassified Prochlorococcus TaxID=2627481 RepID=UPI0005339002|nr:MULTISPECIES: four-carbon acid sugar kinase family protein [unclassified Prochlorococcus]KGG14634.1 hypothetical protein EV06_1693 [Prochlorococcus sp. MIT 0602]KGG15937.1 hypothetical protein EV07_1904 [Prochlorococcus sp. MIT 0603]